MDLKELKNDSIKSKMETLNLLYIKNNPITKEVIKMFEKLNQLYVFLKMLICLTFNPASFLYMLIGFLVGGFVPLFFSLKVFIVFILVVLFAWKGRQYLKIINE
jgi:hypothetical protein